MTRSTHIKYTGGHHAGPGTMPGTSAGGRAHHAGREGASSRAGCYVRAPRASRAQGHAPWARRTELKAAPRAWGGELGRGRARWGGRARPGEGAERAGAAGAGEPGQGQAQGRGRGPRRTGVVATGAKEVEGWVGEREGDGTHRAGGEGGVGDRRFRAATRWRRGTSCAGEREREQGVEERDGGSFGGGADGWAPPGGGGCNHPRCARGAWGARGAGRGWAVGRKPQERGGLGWAARQPAQDSVGRAGGKGGGEEKEGKKGRNWAERREGEISLFIFFLFSYYLFYL
jgi:hypothetical protein